MQGRTARVDSIGSRLGSENEFDGVTSYTSVESCSESKVGLLDSEDRATLVGYYVCAKKLTTAVACTSGWSTRLDFTQVCTEVMGTLGEDIPKVRIFATSEHVQSTEILKGA
jgi:hypothetical protein